MNSSVHHRTGSGNYHHYLAESLSDSESFDSFQGWHPKFHQRFSIGNKPSGAPYFRKALLGNSAYVVRDAEKLIQNGSPPSISNWFIDLAKTSSILTPDKDDIISAVFRFKWSVDSSVNEAFLSFVYNLIASNSYFFQPCIRFLVSSVIQDPLPDQKTVEMVQERLLQFYQLVPSSHNVFVDTLTTNFPHRVVDVSVIVQYLKFILFFISRVSAFRGKLWEVIFSKLLEIDVEIKLEDIIDSDDEDDLKFDDVIDGYNDDSDDPISGQNSLDPHAISELAKSMADKLDSCMEVLFRFISDFYSNCTSETQFLTDLVEFQLDCFDSLLARTHRSKFVQFLIFYSIAVSSERSLKANQNVIDPNRQSNPEAADAFVAFLLKRILSPDAEVERFKPLCVGYLGSFIARASFIPLKMIKFVLTILADWCRNYVDFYGNPTTDIDFSRHLLFYHVAISLLYVLCFHLESIVKSPGGLSFAHSLKLDYLLLSRLNPLKFCLETVANEFGRIAAETGVVDCRNVLLSNSKMLVSDYSDYGQPKGALVDAYFPFDPYLLTESAQFVEPFYRDWGDCGDDDSEGSEMES
ncbi:hypothetical protein P9112_006576 [Eukaryota sp. TZLM1-RC]